MAAEAVEVAAVGAEAVVGAAWAAGLAKAGSEKAAVEMA